MKNNDLNRRKFMDITMKAIAAAAGISVFELEKLLAAEDMQVEPKQTTSRQQEYSIYQKTAQAEIKALKVMVENNPDVFENEYGRQIPVQNTNIKNAVNIGLITNEFARMADLAGRINLDFCSNNFDFSMIGNFSGVCGFNTCGGQSNGDFCDDNDCNFQTCTDMTLCGKNGCGSQECPKNACGINNTSLVDQAILQQNMSDPYVQHLMKQFHVVSADALAIQLTNLLNQRGENMNRKQIVPKMVPKIRE